MAFREYKRRSGTTVHAIRLSLDTPGFDYEKWGERQHCKAGDWILQNGDDVYTVDADVFARTYASRGNGTYEKTGTVWAEQAKEDGSIQTKEGRTHYSAGDYVTYNDRERTDGWAIEQAKFEKTYEPV